MADHHFERQQWLLSPIEQVFDYFSRAENLATLTPPWLNFRILTPQPIVMAAGTTIDYRIRLGQVPLRWRTRIDAWSPPFGFVDSQERGPYATWVHTHRFERLGEGTLMTDHVRYRVPFGLLGELANALYVRSSLAAIFDFRYRTVAELFPRVAAPATR